MKELVKYNNYLNTLTFKDFTSVDFDFLMFLCSEAKEKNTDVLSFHMNDVCERAGYQHKGSIEEYRQRVRSMNRKLIAMTAHLETDTEEVDFALFQTFRVNKKTGTLTVRVNPDFRFILNELTRNFTQFELAEFTELNSKYSKTLYRLLKQYRSTGEYRVKVDELRRLLLCPESYDNRKLMQKIIEPSVRELQKDFPTLSCEAIRARTKGRPVIGYYFTFEADGQVPGQMTMDQAAEVMKQYTQAKTLKQKKGLPKGTEHSYNYDDLERQLLRRQAGQTV